MIKSIRFYITENCNANCHNCFNRMSRSNAIMSVDMFKKLAIYFNKLGIKSVKIMGGEPTTHNDFYKIMQIAHSYFERVGLFTNAINNVIESYCPTENDNITYNFRFSKLLSPKKLLLDQPGGRLLEVQISTDTNIDKLKTEILRVTQFSKKVSVTLTLDCTQNIFKGRSQILKNYSQIIYYLSKNHIPVRKDHKVPICFIYGSDFPITKYGSICSLECAGLVDASGYLRYCNQYSSKLVNMFDDKGDIIEPEIMNNYLKTAYYEIQRKSLQKACANCIYYDKICNGGCFCGKEYISKEDIMCSTQLPVK